MITIIHGTDIAASRKYFLDLKEKYQDPTVINGKTVTITDLVQDFEGGDLFTESKNFFIEDLLSKKSRGAGSASGGKKSKELTQLTDYIATHSKENNIFIWEGLELTKAALGYFKNSEVKVFKLPQSLFLFLDNIRPGNGKTLINLFHETILTSDVEMVYFMMVRQVRLLLGLIENSGSNIEEVQRIAPWQKGKLQTQTDYFEIEQLKKLYFDLFEIEKAMKTGNLNAPLTSTIDFLLLSI